MGQGEVCRSHRAIGGLTSYLLRKCLHLWETCGPTMALDRAMVPRIRGAYSLASLSVCSQASCSWRVPSTPQSDLSLLSRQPLPGPSPRPLSRPGCFSFHLPLPVSRTGCAHTCLRAFAHALPSAWASCPQVSLTPLRSPLRCPLSHEAILTPCLPLSPHPLCFISLYNLFSPSPSCKPTHGNVCSPRTGAQ